MTTNQNNHSQFEELAKKYLNGTISPEEQARFEKWYAEFDDENLLLKSDRYNSSDDLRDSMYQRIEEKIRIKAKNHGFPWKLIAAAVVVLGILSMGIYLYFATEPIVVNNHLVQTNDKQPGRNTAFLSLENGTRVELDNLSDGEQIKIDDAIFQKNKDGEIELVMLPSKDLLPKSSETSYNTISTPRGGNYKMILSDGTQVWLNASSSLRFPTAFSKSERKVELIGEAYFDVSKDKNRSFKVISNGQEIQVLGTEFNVLAYPDEKKMKTTLVEGSVKISNGQFAKIMKPGEQSIINRKGEMEIIDVDVMHVKAWKEGYFAFNKLSIEEVMNQIGRWYDIDVVYEGEMPEKQLTGQISKTENLSTIIKMLEFNGLNLKLEKSSIIIEK